MSIYLYIYLSLSLSLYIYIYIYLYTYIYIYIYILAPTWQRPRTLHGRCRMFRRVEAHAAAHRPGGHTLQRDTQAVHSTTAHTVRSAFTAASRRFALNPYIDIHTNELVD